MLRFGYDVTNGVVIGEMETQEYYRFYDEAGQWIWDAGHFDNDAQAIDAFKAKFPNRKAEMRVWRP